MKAVATVAERVGATAQENLRDTAEAAVQFSQWLGSWKWPVLALEVLVFLAVTGLWKLLLLGIAVGGWALAAAVVLMVAVAFALEVVGLALGYVFHSARRTARDLEQMESMHRERERDEDVVSSRQGEDDG